MAISKVPAGNASGPGLTHWLLERREPGTGPAVSSVIAGATKPEQIRANVNAAGWKLTAEELAEVDRLCP